MAEESRETILIVGVSRGIGQGLAAAYAERGSDVIGTVRDPGSDPMPVPLAAGATGSVRVERLDMTQVDQIEALRERLSGVHLDVLLVSAGITDDGVSPTEIDAASFDRVMNTNALAPMKVIAKLEDLVTERGTIAVLSSRQGSIARNERGDFAVYRASKAALNQLMQSYAAVHKDSSRALLLVAPGWTQSGVGGSDAPLTVDQVVPGIVEVIDANRAPGELRFIDFEGNQVPW